MLFWTIVKVALKSLLANKLRTFLAMLGIIIGVGSVISMLALGRGAQEQVMERISAMGTNLLIVRPGQRGSRGVFAGTHRNLIPDDARAIINEVAGVRQVAPVVRGGVQLKYFNKNAQATVIGSSVTYLPIRNFEIEHGRAFTETEAERKWNRILLLPGDAAYTYVGMQQILDMQKEYKQLKGDSFDRKEFFSKLLSYGALPPRHLKKKILEQ